jgi:pimeloyl-ACP methyl ester carboxylesterase
MNNEFGKYYFIALKARNLTIPNEGDKDAMGGWMVQAMYFSMGKKHNYEDALKNIKSPTLVIHGGNDFQSEKSSRVYSDLISNATFYVVKDAGHFSFNEKPDEFGAVVSEFLGKVK